jgi:chromosome segregation ATPase
MNLFTMSPDEVARWYKPNTEVEKYLVDIISSIDWFSTKDLEGDVERLERQNEDYENDITEFEDDIRILEIDKTKLKNKIDELEHMLSMADEQAKLYKNVIDAKEKNIQWLRDDIFRYSEQIEKLRALVNEQ